MPSARGHQLWGRRLRYIRSTLIHGVEGGIDANSVIPDVIDANRRNISMAERRLLLGVAEGAWRPS